MADIQTVREQEQQRLTAVMEEVRRQLEKAGLDVGDYRKQAVETRKLLWEEYARYIYEFDDAFEIQPQLAELDRREKQEQFYRQLQVKLERIWSEAYFGRMDFQPTAGNGPQEEFYIGIAALTASSSGAPLIYDWRAPVAGMYYDYETGTQAHYQCPDGEVRGKIELKRQFKIENQQLRYFFDSSLQIDDEMLQQVLSQNVGAGMKTIVTSIQREQNQAIRDETHPVLIVTGPAGCGKTSIALHRAAYLLYKRRATLQAEQVLIFSPNPIFSDYISGVLPHLGEENICQTTFQEYLASFLPAGLTGESRDQYLEWLYSSPYCEAKRIRLANFRLKSAPDFAARLERYAHYLEEHHPFTDLVYQGKTVLTAAAAGELFRHQLRYLPIGKRLQQIKKRVLFLLEPLRRLRVKEVERELEQSELRLFPKELRAQARLNVHQEVETWLATYKRDWEMDPLECYRRLFGPENLMSQLFVPAEEVPGELEKIRRQAWGNLETGRLSYEDTFPLLYLQGLILGFPKIGRIKHLIIDEAQDYHILQYRMIQEMFPDSALTILGDRNQTLQPSGDGIGFEAVAGLFDAGSCKTVQLEQTYRSTRQINRFNQRILGENVTGDSGGIREGEKPLLIKADTPESLIASLNAQVRRLNAAGMETVAIICQTESTGRKIFNALEPALTVQLFSGESERFTKGNLVAPVYLAKGLEFDAVIVWEVNSVDYPDDSARCILYTACSRALHQLVLVYSGTLSPLVSAIEGAFYNTGSGGGIG